MERKIQLLESLNEAKQEVELYKELLHKAEKAVKQLERELVESYEPANQSMDLAALRREILNKMHSYPRKIWSLRDVADMVPQAEYQLVSRQLRRLANQGVILWTGGKGTASKYAIPR